ncbi:MAG: T9SS type A sorting domain-containing protein [Bacteroidia bacterium]|nr:T9SS type A sorting domain-containing protein [Bacteroidia bacterium]
MKKVITLAYSVFFIATIGLSQSLTFMKVYGDLPADTTRAYKILSLSDTTFLIGGQWDNKGFIMHVDYDGTMLNYRAVSDSVVGISAVRDMVQLPNGDIIAVGECKDCAPTDTVDHVFALRLNTSLDILNLRLFYGTNPNPLTYGPSLAYSNGVLAVSMTMAGIGFNFEDLLLHALDNQLNTIWSQIYNSCGNCGFEYAHDLAPTSAGFAMIVENVFTDSLRLFHLSTAGSVLWKQTYSISGGVSFGKMVAANGIIYVGAAIRGLPQDPAHYLAVISGIYESDGSSAGAAVINDSLIDERIMDIQLSSNGTLLAGYMRSEPNAFGTYQVSRIYRIDTANFSVLGYVQIPNPNDITNMGIRSVVPFNADGTEFASCGIRGFINRGFFYGNLPCKTKSDNVSATICDGETYFLGTVAYTDSGTYTATLTAANGCDSVVTLNLYVTETDTTVTQATYTLSVPLQIGITYQWISCANNQPVPGAISHSFSPTQSGAYKVAVTSGNCADTSACHNVLATGIDNEFAESLRIYPQPAHDQFWLEMSTPYPAVELQLTDMQGRTVWQKNLQNEVVTTIPVSFLASGVYLLHVQAEGKYAVRKALKQ